MVVPQGKIHILVTEATEAIVQGVAAAAAKPFTATIMDERS